jgi:hypothetical protein
MSQRICTRWRVTRMARSGLQIDGTVQVFNWERPVQERFARHAIRDAKSLINVGYGLGFAQRIFEASKLEGVSLIEVDPFVMCIARRRTNDRRITFFRGLWQDNLSKILKSDATLYFDAFPVTRTFQYTAMEFRRYIEPLLYILNQTSWKACYFVAFDRQKIVFQVPKTLRVDRVLSFAVPRSSLFHTISRISLYQVRRLDRLGVVL